MEQIKISFLVKTAKKKFSGVCPLVCRIKSKGESKEISLGTQIQEEDWDRAKQKVKNRHPEARLINSKITHMHAKLMQIEADMRLSGRTIAPQSIKNSLGGNAKDTSVLDLFAMHNLDLSRRIGNDYSQATYNKYELTRKKVFQFIEHAYDKCDFNLLDMKHGFVADFETFLKAEQNLAHNSAMKHIKNLKKVARLAVKLDMIHKNPFDNFKCSIREVKRECLTREEVDQMVGKTSLNGRLEVVRDVFLFCCYTGLAYADVAKLKISHIHRIDSQMRIILIDRTKTGVQSRIPVLPAAEALILKYLPFSSSLIAGKLFPVNSNQKMNEYLKEIAMVCGIKKILTVHLARHTFATTIGLSNVSHRASRYFNFV